MSHHLPQIPTSMPVTRSHQQAIQYTQRITTCIRRRSRHRRKPTISARWRTPGMPPPTTIPPAIRRCTAQASTPFRPSQSLSLRALRRQTRTLQAGGETPRLGGFGMPAGDCCRRRPRDHNSSLTWAWSDHWFQMGGICRWHPGLGVSTVSLWLCV
jgi:hypothetical protein